MDGIKVESKVRYMISYKVQGETTCMMAIKGRHALIYCRYLVRPTIVRRFFVNKV
jgi:hypothetical protein